MTAKESDFQSKTVIPWLKKEGCFVMKVQASSFVPKGTADIFWCYRKAYGWLEVKASASSEKQVGQQQFLRRMNGWGVFACFVSPENFEEVKHHIDSIIEEEDEKVQERGV